MEEKMNRAMAESEFDRFCDAARINMDRYRNDEDAEEFVTYRERFIEGVQSGRITVDDEGWPTVHTESENLKEVRFGRRPNGFDRCTMDKHHDGAQQTRLFAWIASIVGKSPKHLQGLEEHDMDVVRTVFALFRDA